MEYVVRYERDRDGWWFTSIPEIQGCHTQGVSLVEAKEHIRECLALYVPEQEAASAVLIDKVVMPSAVSVAVRTLADFGIQAADVQILLDSAPA